MVAESWFRNIWKTKKKKHDSASEKQLIGVLAFEVASLMSKLVHLWQSLGDKQVARLRDEVMNSVGIKKLVSEDDIYIARLICREINENLRNVAMVVTRLAKKCSDPLLKSFELAFNELLKTGADPYGWQLTWKKMDRKVKKMEWFMEINANLYQEMETLSDLEQTLRRMKGNGDADNIALVEYEKNVSRKQQEVKYLKEVSLWNRSYDYTVCLLARSVFTIFGRVGNVFGINPAGDQEVKKLKLLESDHIHRSQSVAHSQSSIHPTESSLSRFSSEPISSLLTKSGPIPKTTNTNAFCSGPPRNPTSTAHPISGGNKSVNFYSGPLGMSTEKSRTIARPKKSGIKWWQSHEHSGSLQGKTQISKANKLGTIGPLKGCVMGGNGSPVSDCYLNPVDSSSGALHLNQGVSMDIPVQSNSVFSNAFKFDSKRRLINAPPDSLGAAALALHYANVIIVIEKFVASPHLIGQDAREDLYNMLPASIRAALRAKLKPYAKSLNSSGYDTALAEEWNEAMLGILEWLAPLAHHMIRWQSERSFEHQSFVSRANVLLVQTLYYANQAKTEATITELLVGLNYVWRYSRELNAKAIEECTSIRTFDDYLDD
ncbi:uncharacterized protein LOC116019894 [Ipomoea triloba]|uniref:uncharacterized protein LOC116019894 n=1 Tax=Ipomoea triloba TaxID=35885 RepID=UPI00125D8594|nr:uncharacterized protein LOC116019894 [Ipomoea triloba]